MNTPISGTLSTKQTRKQNITRDIEIKNKLTVIREEVGCDISWIRGKGCQGTCIKDTWKKPKGDRIEGGRWRRLVLGEVVGLKWRKLYLNKNKKRH